MDIIKADHFSYDYIRRDETDKIVSVTHALSDISFEIEEGLFVAVIGHNGSGKSTLARAINGLIKPSEGKLYINGLDTSDDANMLEIRGTAGMVFQNPDNQIISSVVEEDVAFGPENLGVPSAEIEKRVADALEAVGMSEFAKASPGKLSGGQKQRIAIAGALAMKPGCIVLDESTAMLDPVGRQEVMSVVRRLNREEGITVIEITHYMEEAAMADRILVLDGGKLVMDGTPSKVFSDAEKLESYGLELPEAAKLAKALISKGVNLPENILNSEDLTEELLRLFK